MFVFFTNLCFIYIALLFIQAKSLFITYRFFLNMGLNPRGPQLKEAPNQGSPHSRRLLFKGPPLKGVSTQGGPHSRGPTLNKPPLEGTTLH